MISLFGINNIIKLLKFCPGLKYDYLIYKIYHFFENYYLDSKKETNDVSDIIKLMEKKNKLSELINYLIEQEKERHLLYLFAVINVENKLLFLFILLYFINNKIKIIFEYDEASFSSFIGLYNIIKLFKVNIFQKIVDKIEGNKIQNIKLINDNFTFILNDNNTNFNELNQFEIVTFLIKGDKKEKKNT